MVRALALVAPARSIAVEALRIVVVCGSAAALILADRALPF